MGGSQSHVEKRYEAYVVDINSASSSEKKIGGSTAPVSFKTLLDVSKAVCKVKVENETGTGFLAKFATTTGSLMHGLFTNNHVLSERRLADGQTFTIQFDAIPVGTSTNPSVFAATVTTTGLFRFTCPILDATFIHFGDEAIQFLTSGGCRFLKVASGWEGSNGEPVFVFQHPGGADIHFAQGFFLQYYGLDIFHSVSTNYGSSGSPVALSNGQVIGLHKARSALESKNYNIAVPMSAVINAILPHSRGPVFPRYLVCNPIALDPTYAAKFLQIGLERCFVSPTSNFQGLMYVSPATSVLGLEIVTPIWFVPTSHGWYWTPTDPSSRDKDTNWMPVSRLRVIGGYWHDQVPASKNVRIINWLFQHNIVCGICPSFQ